MGCGRFTVDSNDTAFERESRTGVEPRWGCRALESGSYKDIRVQRQKQETKRRTAKAGQKTQDSERVTRSREETHVRQRVTWDRRLKRQMGRYREQLLSPHSNAPTQPARPPCPPAPPTRPSAHQPARLPFHIPISPTYLGARVLHSLPTRCLEGGGEDVGRAPLRAPVTEAPPRKASISHMKPRPLPRPNRQSPHPL